MSNRGTMADMYRWDNVLTVAEQQVDPLEARIALEALRRDAANSERGPTIDVRLARAMILGGETDAGIDLARNLINSDPQPDPSGLVNLVNTLRLYAPELGKELLASMTLQTENIEVLAAQSLALARADRLDEARRAIQDEIEGRTKDDALPYRRALVRVLDQIDAEDATQAAVAISDDYPESSTAQLCALRTKAIWEDLDAARQAVSRLRSAVGERSFAWQTFDARVTLESNPSDAELTRLLSNDDEVEGEKVQDLSDLLSEVPDDFDVLMVTARVHRMIADRAREAGRNTDAAQSVDLAAKYYDRAAGGGLRAFAFKPYITMLGEYGRNTEASRALDRFATIDEIPSGAVVERRELLVEAGRYAEAAEDQNRVAGYGHPESKLYLANLYILAGDQRKAIAELNRFLDQREWDDANLETAANLLAEAGAIARSLEVFGMLPDPHNGSPRDAVIARALMRVGRQEDALLYQLSAARELKTEDSWLSAIRVAEAIGDQERTAEVVREAQDALPDSPAIAAFTDDNSTRKFSLAIAAATQPGENPGATEFRDAALAHGRGEITDDEFLNRLETICNDTPGLLKAWRTRIEFNFLLDRAAEGLTVAQKAAETLPDNPDAIRLLVEALRGEGMADEAIGPAERLLALTMGDRFQPTVVLALLESDRGNVQRVVSLLSEYRDRLIEDSADTPSSGLTALATAYAGLGNPAEASSLFMQRLDGDSPEWQRTALFALRALPDREITARRQWLAMMTSATFAWDWAEQYLRLAQYSGEVSDAERALDLIETHGDDGSNWLWLKANAEGFAGREPEAEATFRRLQEREPDAAFVPQALGELLSHLEGRAEDALAALDAAEQVAEPGDTELLTTIRINRARALNALDRPQEALELLTPALESSDPPMTAVVLSGISYLKLGNLDRASEASQHAQEAPILDARTSRELRTLQSALE
jgi:tetratricopeptide (TPR) repeat protein